MDIAITKNLTPIIMDHLGPEKAFATDESVVSDFLHISYLAMILILDL